MIMIDSCGTVQLHSEGIPSFKRSLSNNHPIPFKQEKSCYLAGIYHKNWQQNNDNLHKTTWLNIFN